MYYILKHKIMEFHVREFIFVKIKLMKGISRFDLGGTLSPMYIWLFEIIRKIGKMTYRLYLLANLSDVRNVFHILIFKKLIQNSKQKFLYTKIEVQPKVIYALEPKRILESNVKKAKG